MDHDLDAIAGNIQRQIARLVEREQFAGNGGHVLIASGRYDKIGTPIEALVGLALARRSARVSYLLCDQVLPACDVRRIDRDAPDICDQCWRNGQYVLRATRLPVIPFGRWLTPDDLDEVAAEIDALPVAGYMAYSVDGVDLGRIAYASTLRHLLRGSLTTPAHWRRFRTFLVAATLMLRVARRALADLNPLALFISHGIYVTWGVLTEYAVLQGIRTVVYGYGYRKGTILVSLGGSYHDTLAAEGQDGWAETPLSPAQRGRIQAYLASRANGGMDWISYNTHPTRLPDALREALNLRADRPVYVLFPNVMWDAAVVFRDAAFPSMADWMRETLAWAVSHPEIQWIVRCHPAEATRLAESQERSSDLIRALFPTLPGHIRLIESDAPVNTYDLSSLAGLALVYTTKVGLEFATRGIPVVVAGEAFYRGKGFTYDPAAPQDYFALLASAAGKPIPGQAELALRYAYYYFFRRYFELRGLGDAGIGYPVLSLDVEHLSALDDYAPLNALCATILDGAAPIAPEN